VRADNVWEVAGWRRQGSFEGEVCFGGKQWCSAQVVGFAFKTYLSLRHCRSLRV